MAPSDRMADASRPDAAAANAAADSLQLRLDGFEGPLDLLLDLARRQKLDLARISVLAVVEQYLAIVEGARRVRLELAADWLVMAAWLTWLKSRLLLPEDEAAAEDGEQAAELLAGRLRDLEVVRAAACWLGERPALGETVFARGAPEQLTETDRSRLLLDLPALVRAYLGALRRAGARTQYRPRPSAFWSVSDALARLRVMLGALPDWSSLDRFLPDGVADAAGHRAAIASTLIAGLELARDGVLILRQPQAFGPIQLRPGRMEPAEAAQ